METTRRGFLKDAALAAAAVPVIDGVAWGAASGTSIASQASPAAPRSATPSPWVDGLSFLGPIDEVAASGLSALILDVTAVERLPTTDGSIKYFRSFEACARSITQHRRNLASGAIPGAFLATKGSEIAGAHASGRTAVFFQFQGCEPIGDDLSRLELFYELGLRVLQITHHNNNAWGGGAIEKTWTGLTKTGIEGVERMNAIGLIPDLSHVSEPTSLDVLRVSRRPVIVSHTAARAIVNNARCTTDAVLRGVAKSGGVTGIFMMSFWLTPDARPTVDHVVAQLRHVIDVGGIDAVGIANDYPIGGEANARKVNNDNAEAITGYLEWWRAVGREGVLGFDRVPTHVVVPELNHPRRMFDIHAALERARFSSTDIEKIMGGNWTRLLSDTLG